MNVPHFEQELDYSCLAACTRMVLAFFGAEHTEAELRALLKTRPGGTSPVNLMLRLPVLGFTADVQTGSQAYLRKQVQAGCPCIVHVWTPHLPHWDTEAIHALVVTDISAGSLSAHDPALSTGPTTIPLSAFLSAWAAVDYLMVVIRPED
ncbi:MAG: cysteine peptidase family C39 domain-containing protein [Anaerolineae bacterium]